MVRILSPLKDSPELILCKFCIKIKNRSKKFQSLHALKWHLHHNHGDEIKQ